MKSRGEATAKKETKDYIIRIIIRIERMLRSSVGKDMDGSFDNLV